MRPPNWKNPYSLSGYLHPDNYDLANKTVYDAFEAGADELWEGLWQMAKDSPTGTFTIDSREVYIYEA